MPTSLGGGVWVRRGLDGSGAGSRQFAGVLRLLPVYVLIYH